jgi:hypothetical protein
MNSILRLIHAKPRLLKSITEVSTIGRAVKLEDGMRADQESRLDDSISGVPVLQRRPPFSGYLRLGLDFGRTDRLGVRGSDLSIHPKAHVG